MKVKYIQFIFSSQQNTEFFLQPLDLSLVLVTNIFDRDRHGLLVGVFHVERLLEHRALVFAGFLDLDVLYSQCSFEFFAEELFN